MRYFLHDKNAIGCQIWNEDNNSNLHTTSISKLVYHSLMSLRRTPFILNSMKKNQLFKKLTNTFEPMMQLSYPFGSRITSDRWKTSTFFYYTQQSQGMLYKQLCRLSKCQERCKQRSCTILQGLGKCLAQNIHPINRRFHPGRRMTYQIIFFSFTA